MTELLDQGILAKAFPGAKKGSKLKRFSLEALLSDSGFVNSKHRFEKAGMMIDRIIITSNYQPDYRGDFKTLSDVLVNPDDIPEIFYIANSDVEKWRNKRARVPTHRKPDISKSRGGRMRFPDSIDLPSRTIMTQEGGRSPNWNTHVIKTADGRHRRLLPIELERLNMFPDNHTKGVIDTNRAFLMGNALVIGIVELIGQQLANEILE